MFLPTHNSSKFSNSVKSCRWSKFSNSVKGCGCHHSRGFSYRKHHFAQWQVVVVRWQRFRHLWPWDWTMDRSALFGPLPKAWPFSGCTQRQRDHLQPGQREPWNIQVPPWLSCTTYYAIVQVSPVFTWHWWGFCISMSWALISDVFLLKVGLYLPWQCPCSRREPRLHEGRCLHGQVQRHRRWERALNKKSSSRQV